MMRDTRLKLRLLGRPQLLLEGQELNAEVGEKALGLLAYVASAAPAPVPRERLIGIFWPDKPEKNGRYRLRHTLWVLRSALGKDHLRSDHTTCHLCVDEDIWVDVLEFQHGCRTLSVNEEDRQPTVEDITTLHTLVALYRDDFLRDLNVRNAPLFEEWLLLERERLRLLYQEALWKLAQAQLAARDDDSAAWTLRQLVEADPLRERSFRALIRLHLQQGDRAAAMQAYRQCAAILREELGIAPSSKTERLRDLIEHDTHRSVGAALRHAELLLSEGRYEEALAVCMAAETLACDPIMGSEITLTQSEIAISRGQYSQAKQYLEHGLAGLPPDAHRQHARAGQLRAYLRTFSGKPPAVTMTELEETLTHAQKACAPTLMFTTLRLMAAHAYLLGRFTHGLELIERSDALAGSGSVPSDLSATCLNVKPMILVERGQIQPAITQAQAALDAVPSESHPAMVSLLMVLGSVQVQALRLEAGITTLSRALTLARAQAAERPWSFFCLTNRCRAYYLQGNITTARADLQTMRHLCRCGGGELEWAFYWTMSAMVGLRGLGFLGAMADLRRAQERLRQLDSRYFLAATHVIDGIVAWRLGQRQTARNALAEALALGAAEGYIQTWLTVPQVAPDVLAFALAEGLEVPFVLDLLERFGPRAVVPLLRLSEHPRANVRARAALALGQVLAVAPDPKERIQAALRRLADDPTPSVALAADKALYNLSQSVSKKHEQCYDCHGRPVK
jgi:DNA-binding SARP family transcriptional activator